ITGANNAAAATLIYSTDNGVNWTLGTISETTDVAFVRDVVYTGRERYPWIGIGDGQDVLVASSPATWTPVGGPSGLPRGGLGAGGLRSITYDAARDRVIAAGFGLVYMGS